MHLNFVYHRVVSMNRNELQIGWRLGCFGAARESWKSQMFVIGGKLDGRLSVLKVSRVIEVI
jgi:hypothetical protein